MFTIVVGVGVLASRGSLFTVRRVPAWRSATGGVSGDARYTAFAFANPTRHVLGNLLLTSAGHVQVERETRAEEDAESTFVGPDMPAGEEGQRAGGRYASVEMTGSASGDGRAAANGPAPHTVYTTDVVEVVETFLYRPLIGPLRRLVSAVKRLQSGRLDAYVSYMLIALVALLAVVVGFA
jgi:hypothetical protein